MAYSLCHVGSLLQHMGFPWLWHAGLVALWHVGSQFPIQGSNLHPCTAQSGLLTTGLPGKSSDTALEATKVRPVFTQEAHPKHTSERGKICAQSPLSESGKQ